MTGNQTPRIRIEPERTGTEGTGAAMLMKQYGVELYEWQPHFGCMLGAKCACINFPRKGDLFMTIMPFLAQGETVAPRQPVMHHDFGQLH